MTRAETLGKTSEATRSNDTARLTLPCVHCGEPTDCRGDQDPQRVFCCNGCRGAYDLIHGWGLEGYYGLRDQLSAKGAATPVRGESSRYEAFDNADFLGPSEPTCQADGLMVTRLAVHGLHCGACAWLIENAAMRTAGWRFARVNLSDHTVRVTFDKEATRLSEIARLMDRLGYELAPISDQGDEHFPIENRRHLTRIAIAGFCAANAMWIGIALYAGDASGVEAEHRFFLRVIGTALGIASVVFPGRTFFAGAIASLRTWTPHMDLPVALGLSVGTIVGLINAVTGSGDVYFDSLAVLVFLLLIGRWIQFHQQHRAAKAVDLLLRITPRHAQRVNGEGQPEWVLADALQTGDVIRVNAAENVPADGRILDGETTLDRSLLTGESRPVPARVNDEVLAGTINLQRPIDVQVEAIGRDSRVGKVMQMVADATSMKTPVVQLADRIGGVFVVAVSLLALAALVAWWSHGWMTAAGHATSLLIVACPCALALATPLAIAVSIGRAAKQGVLIRDGGSLQTLATPGTIWFDKTGTLTEGRPRAQLIWGDEYAVQLAAAVERSFNHPVAEAVMRFEQTQLADDALQATEQQAHFGGVSGVVVSECVLIGNTEFLNDQNVAWDSDVEAAIAQSTAEGASPVLVAINNQVSAVLAIRDPIKPDAAETIARLKQQGWNVGILSGDHPAVVDAVAGQLGIESQHAHGGLSPEEKLKVVQVKNLAPSNAEHPLIMIGDGANDAAALAAADVGIAVRGGAEVSLQAAPVFIASGEVASVGDLIVSAVRTGWLIRSTFTVSLAYNVIAVGLALAGKISPLVAAILMPISSVSVLALTLAWPTYRVFSCENRSPKVLTNLPKRPS